jgi:hypothetical protein
MMKILMDFESVIKGLDVVDEGRREGGAEKRDLYMSWR